MSEYKCQEPGCNFHIGIAGDLVTDLDFEQQDYYDQEVEEHYQMHKSEADNEKQDSYWVKVLPATAELLDRHGLMQAHRNVSGHEVPNPLFKPLADSCRMQTLDGDMLNMVRLSPFSAAAREFELGSVPANDPVGSGRESFELGQQRGIGTSRFVLHNANGGVLADVEFDSTTAVSLDAQADGGIRLCLSPAADSFDERVSDPRVSLQSKVTIDKNDGFHDASLSVDDAPNGAVVSTPESTERGQTPASSEKEIPSAVAPAEGEAKLERSNPRAGRARSLGQADGDAGLDQKLLLAVRQADLDPLSRSALHDLLDALTEGRDVFIVTQPDLVWAIEKLLGHSSSLSVDDAPDGAVGGTSESTERGLTPTSSEKGKPSAVAPAEGGETKTNQ